MEAINLTRALKSITPKAKINAKRFKPVGKYPIVSQEASLISGYWNDENDVMHFENPVVVYGDHTRSVKYVDFDFVVGADGVKILEPNENLNTKYLYYWLLANPVDSLGYSRHYRLLKEKSIYLPTLEEQGLINMKLDVAFEKIDQAIQLTGQNIKNVRKLYNATFQSLMSDASGTEVILSDVCEISTKLVDPKEEPYLTQIHIGAANIETGTGKLIDLKTAQEEKLISGKFPFDENTILYSKIRPYLMKVSRPDFPGICSADVYPLSVGDELDKDYLFYLLLSPDFTQYAIDGSQRAGMPKVNREHLFAYTFNLPDRAYQEAVAQKLDNLLTLKNLAVEKYNRKLDYLLSLKHSLLNQSFSVGDVK